MSESLPKEQLSRPQSETVQVLKGEWQKNQPAIKWFGEKLRNFLVVATSRCGDARDVKSVSGGLSDESVPAIDPIKSVAGYPRPDKEELVGLITRVGMFEVSSHDDPDGRVNNIGKEKGASFCGGEGAKFGFYGSSEYQAAVSEGKDYQEINKLLGNYVENLVSNHDLPQETAETVMVDLTWARSKEVAGKYWKDYLGEGEWQDELVGAITDNLVQFRDRNNTGLDAFVRAYAYTRMIQDQGVVSDGQEKWVSVSMVNHRIQTAVPTALFKLTNNGGAEVYLPETVEGDFSINKMIEGWSELMVPEGKLSMVDVKCCPGLVKDYYTNASKTVVNDSVKDKTASQGDFYLAIDAGESIPALVYAGGVLKKEASFWVRLLGKNKQKLSYRDRRVLRHLGYGEHLQTNNKEKGMILFVDSKDEAKDILKYVFIESWGKEYKHKDNVVVMVTEKQDDGSMVARYYGTQINDFNVSLVEAS